MEFTIEMALVDYIPVAFFAIAAFILMRDLYNKMTKLSFLVFALGVSAVTVAGACKATWKLLYAASGSDLAPLTQCSSPPSLEASFLQASVFSLCFFSRKRLHTV